MNYILDENGNPKLEPDVIKWSDWWKTADRIVKKTNMLDASVLVSTVFLAIDHDFGGISLSPVLWETMVFDGKLDGECERYRSLEDAKAGHDAMVARVRKES